MKIILLLVVLAFGTREAAAQISNFGTEFFGVFALNQRVNFNDPSYKLFIFALRTTSVHIEVPSLNFAKDTQAAAFSLVEVRLPNADSSSVELQTNGVVLPGAAVHITSEQPISVLGLNYKQFTSDAFQIYPKEVLGTEYVVLAYPNSSAGGAPTTTGSLFTIAAAEDSTSVTIVSTTFTVNGGPAGTPSTVLMNRGDAIMVMPDIDQPLGDLTGSIVTADKPIAVFSGHERSEVPTGSTLPGTAATSRDHLYEQLLPTPLLGDTLVIVPYNIPQTGRELVRVMASQPSTVLEANGLQMTLDSAGDFIQLDSLTVALVFRSTKGIVAGQYMHSATEEQGITGDPSLALILPTNLYSRLHTFISIPDIQIVNHYVSIIALSADPAVTIDGVLLPKTIFQSVSSFPFSYTTLNMSPGLHTISSDVPLNAHAIGTGVVISYAYNIGLGRDIPGAVGSQSPGQPNVRFAASFDERDLLAIRSHTEHPARIRFTVYDVAGRELYAAPQVVTLSAGQTFATDYKRETRPIYILIQEYDAFGRQLGAPVFLPVP